ncbi:MAG: polysaccharide pyruvyl transferase family protein [Candidatus Kaistia colombiensis]|nr:MAG: polysaccharide pyruvyl transferase family protein [Kaistia sp.]
MITAVADALRAGPQDRKIAALTDGAIADAAASRLGLQALRLPWEGEDRFWRSLSKCLRRERVRAVIIVGADVLDGGYGSWIAKRLLEIGELAAARDIPVVILGFSFKAEPADELREIWSRLNPAISVHVRDPRSLERFQTFSGRTATLVTDCAFLLREQAGPTSRKVGSWADSQRERGRRVLGINFHPQLFDSVDNDGFRRLDEAFRHAVAELVHRHAMSFVILPHDNRPGGERTTLATFAANLDEGLCEQVLFVGEDIGPAEIKAITGQLDGVVAGRMHLAIASLGAGTPVFALTYKDKFEGLFDHFGLPSWLLASPDAAGEPNHLLGLVRRFGETLGPLRLQVARKLPEVRRKAERNLETLGLFRRADPGDQGTAAERVAK